MMTVKLSEQLISVLSPSFGVGMAANSNTVLLKYSVPVIVAVTSPVLQLGLMSYKCISSDVGSIALGLYSRRENVTVSSQNPLYIAWNVTDVSRYPTTVSFSNVKL